jgi:hypothetical protein
MNLIYCKRRAYLEKLQKQKVFSSILSIAKHSQYHALDHSQSFFGCFYSAEVEEQASKVLALRLEEIKQLLVQLESLLRGVVEMTRSSKRIPMCGKDRRSMGYGHSCISAVSSRFD